MQADDNVYVVHGETNNIVQVDPSGGNDMPSVNDDVEDDSTTGTDTQLTVAELPYLQMYDAATIIKDRKRWKRIQDYDPSSCNEVEHLYQWFGSPTAGEPDDEVLDEKLGYPAYAPTDDSVTNSGETDNNVQADTIMNNSLTSDDVGVSDTSVGESVDLLSVDLTTPSSVEGNIVSTSDGDTGTVVHTPSVAEDIMNRTGDEEMIFLHKTNRRVDKKIRRSLSKHLMGTSRAYASASQVATPYIIIVQKYVRRFLSTLKIAQMTCNHHTYTVVPIQCPERVPRVAERVRGASIVMLILRRRHDRVPCVISYHAVHDWQQIDLLIREFNDKIGNGSLWYGQNGILGTTNITLCHARQVLTTSRTFPTHPPFLSFSVSPTSSDPYSTHHFGLPAFGTEDGEMVDVGQKLTVQGRANTGIVFKQGTSRSGANNVDELDSSSSGASYGGQDFGERTIVVDHLNHEHDNLQSLGYMDRMCTLNEGERISYEYETNRMGSDLFNPSSGSMHVTAQLLAICISAATMSILVPHLPSRTEWGAVAYHHEGNRIDLHDRLSSERATVVITGEPACIYTAIHSRHSNNDIDSTGTDIGTIMGNSDALNDANVMSVREEDFLKAARNVTNSTGIGNHSLDPNPDNVSNNKENDLAIHALIIQEGDVAGNTTLGLYLQYNDMNTNSIELTAPDIAFGTIGTFRWHDVLCPGSDNNYDGNMNYPSAEYTHSELLRIDTHVDNTNTNIEIITLGSSSCTTIVAYTSTDGTISNRIGVYIECENPPSIGNAPTINCTLIKNDLHCATINFDDTLSLVLSNLIGHTIMNGIIHGYVGMLAIILMVNTRTNKQQRIEYTTTIDNGNASAMHQLDSNQSTDYIDQSDSLGVNIAVSHYRKIDYGLKEHERTNTGSMYRNLPIGMPLVTAYTMRCIDHSGHDMHYINTTKHSNDGITMHDDTGIIEYIGSVPISTNNENIVRVDSANNENIVRVDSANNENIVRVDSDQNSNITTEEYGYECHSNGNNDNVTYASLETHPSSITLQPDKTCTLPQLMLTGIRHHYDMLYIALASYSLQPNHSMDIHSNMGSTHHDDVSNMQLLLCGESTNDDDEIGATRRYKEWKVVNTDSDSTIATGMNMPNHSGSRANDKQSSWMLDHDNGHQHLTMAFERMDCSYCSRYSRLLFDWMTSEITTNRRGVTSTGKCQYYLVRICMVSSGYPFGGRSFSGNKWNLQLHELID
jgi:hypothetical protein